MRDFSLRFFQGLERYFFPIVWALVIVLLPITSMPLVADLAHSDMVAAPAALPLAGLAALWFLPYLLRRGKLPYPTAPFLGFILIAILSSLLAYFTAVPSLKGKSVLSREASALFTLAVGACFYLVASTWPNTKQRLQVTLRLINFSGLVMIFWALLQAYYTFKVHAYPSWMSSLQSNYISVSNLFDGRVTGFAFEPSWFGNQLNMLYLPLWIAASVCRYSAHRYKLFGISFENILLIGGLAAMFFSYSRIGFIAVLLVVGYLLLLVNLFLIRKIRNWLQSAIHVNPTWQLVIKVGIPVLVPLAFLLFYAAGAYGLARLASQTDARVEALFSTPPSFTYNYINSLRFAERALYWGAGWNIFNDHPILGVGIGNAGFYFQQALPPFAWQLKEVNDIMFHTLIIPNTKSLWSRILAETGIVGFSFFIAWCFLLWQTGRALLKQSNPLIRTLGLAGTLGLVALLAEGFSVDSFALPYLWITQGLLTACCLQLWVPEPAKIASEAAAVPISSPKPIPHE